ncbi:MAG: helix-turn-helix transcriptional regulator [Proteobacteria bacterium]|nr:helix-turn-helix transcriptional regulator [Pseudomonadota bacterium]
MHQVLEPHRFLFQGVVNVGSVVECGLHRTYISGVERGVRNPTVLVLEEIALALSVPSAKLLEDVPRKRARR